MKSRIGSFVSTDEKDIYDEDVMSISWSVDDVIEQAKMKGIEVSLTDARRILREIERQHDAEIGINWDVINFHIDIFAEECSASKPADPEPAHEPELDPVIASESDYIEEDYY